MRLEPRVGIDRGGHDAVIELEALVDAVAPEIAIFQAQIDVRRNRITNAGDRLPGEAAVLCAAGEDVVDQVVAGIRLDMIFGPRPAGAAAGVEAEAVLVAEVEQHIDHGRQDGRLAGGVHVRDRRRVGVAFTAGVGDGPAVILVPGLLPAKLTLEADHPKIVAGDDIEIDARLVIDSERAVEIVVEAFGRIGTAEIDVRVLREEDAAFDPEIATAVARRCGRCNGGRGCGCQ